MVARSVTILVSFSVSEFCEKSARVLASFFSQRKIAKVCGSVIVISVFGIAQFAQKLFRKISRFSRTGKTSQITLVLLAKTLKPIVLSPNKTKRTWKSSHKIFARSVPISISLGFFSIFKEHPAHSFKESLTPIISLTLNHRSLRFRPQKQTPIEKITRTNHARTNHDFRNGMFSKNFFIFN